MANLNDKLKKVITNLEDNIENKKDLEYSKTQIFQIFSFYLEELDKINETIELKLDSILQSEADLQQKIDKLSDSVKSIEKDIYAEEDSELSIVCPYCNNEFTIDTDKLKSEVVCPECNNTIELDWNMNEEEHHCHGSCCDCDSDCNDENDEDM